MSEQTNEDLRVAIETALRRRDPGVRVIVERPGGAYVPSLDDATILWASSMHGDEATALRMFARGLGLCDDGSDPVADVERLTAEVATLTRDAARLATERAFTDEEWRRDMADLRAQMDRARVEASKDWAAHEAALATARREYASLVAMTDAEVATLTQERDEARASVNELAAARSTVDQLLGVVGSHGGEVARLQFDRESEAARHAETIDVVREYFAAVSSAEPITPEFATRWAAAREAVRKIVEGDR